MFPHNLMVDWPGSGYESSPQIPRPYQLEATGVLRELPE